MDSSTHYEHLVQNTSKHLGCNFMLMAGIDLPALEAELPWIDCTALAV